LGGSYIAGAGPLFEGLPQRQAFSWEYQLLAQNPSIMNNLRVKRSKDAGNYQNIAMRIPGVETLVGALTDWNFDPNHKQPGTAVGVIPCGKRSGQCGQEVTLQHDPAGGRGRQGGWQQMIRRGNYYAWIG
jgi:hypothetical protein